MLIKIEVTKFCDQKCLHCSFSRKYSQDSRHLTLADLKNNSTLTSKLQNSHVLITGGEPLLNPEIFEIINYLSEKVVYITLATNGLPLINNEKMIEQLAHSKVNEVLISVTTSSNEYKTVRNSDLLEKVVNLTQTLKAINPKMIITGNYLAHYDNFKELMNLIDLKSSFNKIRFLTYKESSNLLESPFKQMSFIQLLLLELKLKLNSLFNFGSKFKFILLKPDNDDHLKDSLFVQVT